MIAEDDLGLRLYRRASILMCFSAACTTHAEMRCGKGWRILIWLVYDLKRVVGVEGQEIARPYEAPVNV
jgi:hypothetical protein